MKQSFKMAWGKGAICCSVIGIIMELVLIYEIFIVGLFYLGIGFLILCMMLVCFLYATIKNSCYEIIGNKIIVKYVVFKYRNYPIDRIQKIAFVDCGTDWQRTHPNSRYQLAIFFDRKYLKSIEPIRFGPEDREAFVDSLLEINPNIVVDRQETII